MRVVSRFLRAPGDVHVRVAPPPGPGRHRGHEGVQHAAQVAGNAAPGVREAAIRDQDGRPLCPHCLVTDPANQETCAGCDRRRPVSVRTPAGPLCPSCRPLKTATCGICGRQAPCVTSLARLLGIHITVAVAWQRASAGDWAAYAAEISRRKETGNDTPT
jgi:hypothetical protein